MEVEEVLKELDLTDSEISIYMSLLKNGDKTASAAAKDAGVQRRLAYDVMDSLREKGLVSYVDRENKRVYSASSPEKIREMIEDRKRDLEELDSMVEEALPGLMKQFNEDEEEREVKILEGKEGVKRLFNDELRADDTIHVLGSPSESENILEYFLPSWTRKRQEEGIRIKGVFEHSMKDSVGEHQPIEARFLPEGRSSKVSVAVYGDRVGIISWLENPLVIMIKDGNAADSFLNYFEMVWSSAESSEQSA